MDRLVLICFVLVAILEGYNQMQSSSIKADAFTNYVNSNAQQEETANQQSNAIKVKF